MALNLFWIILECGKFSAVFGRSNLTADSAKQNLISRASRINLVKFDSFASRPQKQSQI
ncbi:hypothetical protein [Campylobacter showae]|uniref:hypothetical protein n=1 Tax=Campylobacter showae TaxID=204 RepID=UPI0028D2A654|nr:hypothetical protein [Campylobacter showae]